MIENKLTNSRQQLSFFFQVFLPARVLSSKLYTMLVVERQDTLCGTVYKPLPLSLQTLCTAEDVLRHMQKHVCAADNSVNGLHVEFQGARVYLTRVEELRIVAQLAAAHNNALVEEHFKYQKDLYGQPYTRVPDNVYEEPQTKPSGPTKKDKNDCRGEKDEWDEEMHGDRYVFDTSYEQHEDLLPWTDKRREEQFGWYM